MLWPNPEHIDGISDHQRGALATAFQSRVGILTGGPGTGKTFTAASALKAISREYGTESLAVCAPTGKAAVRITEAMQGAGLALARDATTIHRLLGVTRNGRDKGGWAFAYGPTNPLPFRFVAIDEVSMLDTGLAASLFSACLPSTHILLIGDTGQLPPVGHGAPLRDFIRAGVPHGELTEIHRNQGDVVTACQAIRAGGRARPSEYIDIPAGRNWKHVEQPRPGFTMKSLERLLESLPSSYNPIWDVQVLCAVNEKSELSRVELNRLMQGLLNPPTESNGNGSKAKFRIGDKVICTSNTMLPLCYDGTDEPVKEGGEAVLEFVANGEIGRVLHCEPKLAYVRFDSPARTVKLAGGYVDAFELAYAVTVHKSQGSQWPIVIYMVDDYAGARFVASRELVYTALSRMQKLAVTIGKLSTLHLDCQREALSGRKTFLTERLIGAI